MRYSDLLAYLLATVGLLLSIAGGVYIALRYLQYGELSDAHNAWLAPIALPLLGFVVIQLIAGRALWWPHKIARRDEDAGEYWFRIGLQLATVILIVVVSLRMD